jgi:hypothetical protein
VKRTEQSVKDQTAAGSTATGSACLKRFEALQLARSIHRHSLSTVLSTDGKISAYCERKSDKAIFAIYLALSTSERVEIMWENHPAIDAIEALYQLS